MSRRPPRGPLQPRIGKYGDEHGGRWSSPWVIRIVAGVAVVILAVALVYAALHGFLFALPKR